jgi:hypothetical protein
MSIPASGTVGISTIRSELDNGGTAPFSLAKAGMPTGGNASRGDGYTPVNQNSSSIPNTSSPYGVNEWYSYNHTQNGSCGTTYTTISVLGQYLYYRINVTGISGAPSDVSVTMNSYSADTYLVRIYDFYPFSTSGGLSASPLTTLTYTSNGTQTYTYTMASTSDILYIVCWNNSIT